MLHNCFEMGIFLKQRCPKTLFFPVEKIVPKSRLAWPPLCLGTGSDLEVCMLRSRMWCRRICILRLSARLWNTTLFAIQTSDSNFWADPSVSKGSTSIAVSIARPTDNVVLRDRFPALIDNLLSVQLHYISTLMVFINCWSCLSDCLSYFCTLYITLPSADTWKTRTLKSWAGLGSSRLGCCHFFSHCYYFMTLHFGSTPVTLVLPAPSVLAVPSWQKSRTKWGKHWTRY